MHRLTHRQKAEKERKNPAEEDPEFQIAPMIDILLVLLVFFMSISSTEVLQSNHEINLPVAMDAKDAGKGDHPGQVIVNITWIPMADLGSIEISEKKYPDADSIIPTIQAQMKADPSARVLIRADRAVKWAYLKTVMRAVAAGGVSNVTFSVVSRDKPVAH